MSWCSWEISGADVIDKEGNHVKELSLGQKVYTHTLFGADSGTVIEIKDTEAIAESNTNYLKLHRDPEGWRCGTAMDKRGLEKWLSASD